MVISYQVILLSFIGVELRVDFKFALRFLDVIEIMTGALGLQVEIRSRQSGGARASPNLGPSISGIQV